MTVTFVMMMFFRFVIMTVIHTVMLSAVFMTVVNCFVSMNVAMIMFLM